MPLSKFIRFHECKQAKGRGVKAFYSVLPASSSTASGISKVRISSSASAWLIISLFMAFIPMNALRQLTPIKIDRIQTLAL
jgi:hypothetical protein